VKDAFNRSAERLSLSNGTPATAHVRASDLGYLSSKVTEVFDVGSPLSVDTGALQDSASSGE
jgi:hypothetical protein